MLRMMSRLISRNSQNSKMGNIRYLELSPYNQYIYQFKKKFKLVSYSRELYTVHFLKNLIFYLMENVLKIGENSR